MNPSLAAQMLRQPVDYTVQPTPGPIPVQQSQLPISALAQAMRRRGTQPPAPVTDAVPVMNP